MTVIFVDEQIGYGNGYVNGGLIQSFSTQILGVPTVSLGSVSIIFEYFGDFDVGFPEEYVELDIEGVKFGPYTGAQYDGAFGPADPTTVNLTIDQSEWSRIVADGVININYILGSGVNHLSDAPGAEEFFRTTFTWEANSAPYLIGPSQLSIGENQFLIAPLAAVDPDGDTLTYAIVGGDDAALFAIDAKTGALSFLQTPDFEAPGSAAGSNIYQVRVEVSDGSLRDSKLFQISVTDSNDQKVGTAGNDVFHASAAFEHFQGGDGRDTVVFSGARSAYTIDVQPDGSITVAHGNGIDTLDSIERLQFDDGTLAFDFDDAAGQAYRLYQAAFDRAPDAEGLAYWIDYLDDGTIDLDMTADRFVDSAEFIRLYGDTDSVSNGAYIELLYQNALGRQSDVAGFAFWLDNLDSGAIDRGDALAFFSESPENIDQLASTVADGMWYA